MATSGRDTFQMWQRQPIRSGAVGRVLLVKSVGLHHSSTLPFAWSPNLVASNVHPSNEPCRSVN